MVVVLGPNEVLPYYIHIMHINLLFQCTFHHFNLVSYMRTQNRCLNILHEQNMRKTDRFYSESFADAVMSKRINSNRDTVYLLQSLSPSMTHTASSATNSIFCSQLGRLILLLMKGIVVSCLKSLFPILRLSVHEHQENATHDCHLVDWDEVKEG
jgi:hypothetical protein